MNKQQRRKDHKKSYTKAFMEAFKNMSPKSLDEGGRAKVGTYDVFTGKSKKKY